MDSHSLSGLKSIEKMEKLEIPLTSIVCRRSRREQDRHDLRTPSRIGFPNLFAGVALCPFARSVEKVTETILDRSHLMMSSRQAHQNSEMHLDSNLPHHRPRSSTMAHDSTTLCAPHRESDQRISTLAFKSSSVTCDITWMAAPKCELA
jgi:hypothetical protein